MLSFVLVASLAAATHMWGQACPDGQMSITDAMQRAQAVAEVAEAMATWDIAAARLAEAKERPNPRAAKQVQAPSDASPSASPVDAPSMPELVGLAIDSKLLSLSEQQAFSVSLNPFAFATLARPNMSETEYQSFAWLRRLDGQLSLGGQGVSFDRDGDGKADPALRVENLADSVAWEVRVRILGSRDRREKSFVDRYTKRVLQPLGDELDATKPVAELLQKAADANTLCLTDAQFEAAVSDPSLRPRLERLAQLAASTRAAMDQSVKDLDRRLVVTLFASGTERKAELGPDKTGFGLRAGWGRGLLDHTLNVDWNRLENLAGAPDARTFKLGYEASGELGGAGFEGSKLSLFAAYERYSNVPEAKHRTIAKAGGKLDVRLADGLRLPLSVTWANHKDLLAGADEVVGNVAITLDLSDLRKKKATP
jgi:hypothetical protein